MWHRRRDRQRYHRRRTSERCPFFGNIHRPFKKRCSCPTDRAITVHNKATDIRQVYLETYNEDLQSDKINVESILRQTRLLHMAGMGSPEQVNHVEQLVGQSSEDVMLSLAVSSVEAKWGLSVFQNLISRADVLFVDKKSLEILCNTGWRKAVRICRNLGVGSLVLFLSCGEKETTIRKRGKAACINTYITDHEYECNIESAIRKWPNLIDTTGVQDIFAAGYLYGLLNGISLEQRGFVGDIVA